MKINLILLFTLLFSAICCKKNSEVTTITGNIPNLPDGTIYLFKDYAGNKIDSTTSKNGVFSITHIWEDNELNYIGINHIDKKGVSRFFTFTTQAKYRGVSGWGTNIFMSDANIVIDGNLKYNKFINFKTSADIKYVTGPPLKAGSQTQAFYNMDGDLFDNITPSTFFIVKEKLKVYPFSFHLLYKINENKNSFSPQQVDEFLKLFKGEITESESYRKLSAYNQKRFSEKKVAMPLLENSTGKKSEILDSKYKKHLIVFWASWCGPCRQEIPLLKTIYKNKNPELEFISISIDEDKKAWKKALDEEQMIWKQFIITEKDPDYEKVQMRFRLNGAIPYTVLIDSDFKIIKATVGLSSEKDLQDFIKIEKSAH